MKNSLTRSLPIALCLCVTACGGSSDVKPFDNLVRTTGTVTLDGQPLEKGTISFFPENPTSGCQPASGEIHNGSFTMNTTVSAPGVVAGKYKVRINSAPEGATAMPVPGQATTAPTSPIPQKYTDINTSGLEATVASDAGPFKFELVSK